MSFIELIEAWKNTYIASMLSATTHPMIEGVGNSTIGSHIVSEVDSTCTSLVIATVFR